MGDKSSKRDVYIDIDKDLVFFPIVNTLDLKETLKLSDFNRTHRPRWVDSWYTNWEGTSTGSSRLPFIEVHFWCNKQRYNGTSSFRRFRFDSQLAARTFITAIERALSLRDAKESGSVKIAGPAATSDVGPRWDTDDEDEDNKL